MNKESLSIDGEQNSSANEWAATLSDVEFSPTVDSEDKKPAKLESNLPSLESEEKLSPKDAANEYLALLDELSQDFTNSYYSGEGGAHHFAKNITVDLADKYSDNPHYHIAGHGTEAGGNDKTVFRIASADRILANEINWRNAGEEVVDKMSKIDQEIADLDKSYSEKSRLGKFFGKKGYETTKKNLENSKKSTEWESTGKFNHAIAEELAYSYNKNGRYDFDPNNNDHGQTRNEEDNSRFFGNNNPERAKKVERAIELRQKYASEWENDKAA